MTRNLPLAPEVFEKALKRLMEMVMLGMTHIKIGRGLGQSVSDDPAIAHVAPVFWSMSITAHLDLAQLIAFKLFDLRHGTMTVEYLLDRAEELKTSFPNATAGQVEAVVDIARGQIVSLGDSLKKIRAKRNRVLAHVDPAIVSSPEKVAKQVELTFSDLNLVLNTAGNILNEISVKFRDGWSLYEMLGTMITKWRPA